MPTSDFKIDHAPARPTLVVRFTAPAEQMTRELQRVLPAAFGLAVNRGQSPGMPFARYHSRDPAALDVEAGVILDAPAGGHGDVVASALPATDVAMALYTGPYDGLAEALAELEAWARAEGRRAAEGPWEVYLTDAADEPDVGKHQTQIYLPLR